MAEYNISVSQLTNCIRDLQVIELHCRNVQNTYWNLQLQKPAPKKGQNIRE